jgi:hypothetical protein
MAQLEIVKAESSNESTHGGARPGAGRKPKALRYASELATAEQKIMSALPAAIDSLVAAAQCGDVAAAKYLLERAFGRVQVQSAAIADDKAIPFDESDVERAESKRAWLNGMDTW